MSPLRLLYIASLGLLGVLLALGVLRPAVGPTYGEVQRVQLLERPDQWIVQLSITNREGGDTGYRIEVLEGERYSVQYIVLREEQTFTYIYHVYRDSLKTGRASFTLYREGHQQPVEQLTYHLTEADA
jgi:hypothetical protein